jgi:hypothetical protein
MRDNGNMLERAWRWYQHDVHDSTERAEIDLEIQQQTREWFEATEPVPFLAYAGLGIGYALIGANEVVGRIGGRKQVQKWPTDQRLEPREPPRVHRRLFCLSPSSASVAAA